MALTDDLANIERRLIDLEKTRGQIRIGVFEGFVDQKIDSQTATYNVQGGEGGRVTLGGIFSYSTIGSAFLKGNVTWTENDQPRNGQAIMLSAREVLILNNAQPIPPRPRPNRQVLLFFVSGIIFALPMEG